MQVPQVLKQKKWGARLLMQQVARQVRLAISCEIKSHRVLHQPQAVRKIWQVVPQVQQEKRDDRLLVRQKSSSPAEWVAKQTVQPKKDSAQECQDWHKVSRTLQKRWLKTEPQSALVSPTKVNNANKKRRFVVSKTVCTVAELKPKRMS